MRSKLDDRALGHDLAEAGARRPNLRAGLRFVAVVLLLAATVPAASAEPDPTRGAVAAYRAGRLDAGDALAAQIKDPLSKTALEWVALRNGGLRIGFARLAAFSGAHPDWPAAKMLRRMMEARLQLVSDPVAVQAFFADRAPETVAGKLALARALKVTGRTADAVRLARSIFREDDLDGFAETMLRAAFGADLTKGDFKYRADRLLYNGHVSPALIYAAQAGSDVLALARARAAVIAERPSDQAIAVVPQTLRDDPGLVLARVQKLRRADRSLEAAWLMESAPHDALRLVDGDAWWDERRLLARKLLDAGKINAAYVMCAMSTPVSTDATIEAHFHAGWIALRFLHQPDRARYHFDQAAALARSPSSVSRIAYWQGRAAEASDAPDRAAAARPFYEKALVNGATYHGQLARELLGARSDLVRQMPLAAIGDRRAEAVRVIERLFELGAGEDAFALAVETAANIEDQGQVAALAAVVDARQDAHLSLVVGKTLSQRGLPADALAFPSFGIPAYQPTPNAAPQWIVYSVARQESAFKIVAVSKAGAKGLMQMIESTARHTAMKERLPFDRNRLLHDAAFNARLGAAHLGELLAEQKGSLILTFAAYNAGGGRVQQWIEAYGDPRKPDVDPVDWVERIPFGETRNYVQRVLANVAMYESIFAGKGRGKTGEPALEARLQGPAAAVLDAHGPR